MTSVLETTEAQHIRRLSNKAHQCSTGASRDLTNSSSSTFLSSKQPSLRLDTRETKHIIRTRASRRRLSTRANNDWRTQRLNRCSLLYYVSP